MFQREGVVTSTPMAHGRHTGGPDNSWEQSMESPFDSVDRRLREDLRIGGGGTLLNGNGAGEGLSGEVDMPTPSLPSGYSLPGLGKGYGSTVDGSAADFSVELGATPKANGKPKATTRDNPFGSPAQASSSSSASASGGRWNGIADLRSTPLNAGKIAKDPHGKSRLANEWMVTAEDDSDDDLKFAMSPPVTMTFGTLPPRMQAAVKVSQTPRKASVAPAAGPSGNVIQEGGNLGGRGEDPARRDSQARMILDDLMEEMERGYEPSPRMPTPERFGRYSILPSEGAQGRNLLADLSAAGGVDSASNANGNGRDPAAPVGGYRKSLANTSFGSDIVQKSSRGIYTDEDSELMDGDESYDTISGPSILGSGAGAGAGAAPAQVGGIPGGQYDDSFSVLESPPHSGAYYHTASDTGSGAGGEGASMVFGGPRRDVGDREKAFELMRRDGEMETYFGGRLEDAAGDDVATSPTNAVRR